MLTQQQVRDCCGDGGQQLLPVSANKKTFCIFIKVRINSSVSNVCVCLCVLCILHSVKGFQDCGC